jgi:hypothetical protein
VINLSAVEHSAFFFQKLLLKLVFVDFGGRLVFPGSAWLALQFTKQMFQRMFQLGGRTVDRLFQGIGFVQHGQRLMAFWPRFQAAT